MSMASSLPSECLQEIFSQMEYDVQSLHACLLVNRRWCKNVVPLLWRRTFHLNEKPTERRTHKKLVAAYLPFLSSESRSQLGLHIPKLGAPLFDYPVFLRELSFQELYVAVGAWWKWRQEEEEWAKQEKQRENLQETGSTDNKKLVSNVDDTFMDISDGEDDRRQSGATEDVSGGHETEDDELAEDTDSEYHDSGDDDSEDQDSEDEAPKADVSFQMLVARELCKLFMSRCPALVYLSLATREREIEWIPLDYLALPRFPGARRCLSHLRVFDYCGSIHNSPSGLYDMSQYCHEIRELHLDEVGAEAMAIIFLIEAQKGLKKFVIENAHRELPMIINTLKSHAHSLRHVEFGVCDFDDGTRLDSIASCKNLTALRFLGCENITPRLLQPLVNATFPRLGILDFSRNNVPIEEVEGILRNSNGNVHQVYLRGNEEYPSSIIDIVATHCPNLIIFHAKVEQDAIQQLCTLFQSCRKLYVLKLYGDMMLGDSGNTVVEPELTQQIGELMPPSLRFLKVVTRCPFTVEAVEALLSQENPPRLNFVNLRCFGEPSQHLACIRHYAEEKGMTITNWGIRRIEWLRNVAIVYVQLLTDLM